jgi:hypothetical protein
MEDPEEAETELNALKLSKKLLDAIIKDDVDIKLAATWVYAATNPRTLLGYSVAGFIG